MIRVAPLVSIVINNYNYGRFVGSAIESALEQSYSNTEVIVVDDGSTDTSREVIASFGDRIGAVLKANGGQASAYNAGFAASKGDPPEPSRFVLLWDYRYLTSYAVANPVPQGWAYWPGWASFRSRSRPRTWIDTTPGASRFTECTRRSCRRLKRHGSITRHHRTAPNTAT